MEKKQFYRSSDLPDADGSASKKTRPIGDNAGRGAATTPASEARMTPEPETPPRKSPPKTRPLGHGGSRADTAPAMDADDDGLPVVGWLVVFKGPGRGKAVQLVNGMNSIGRGDDQAVQVDFGDESISRGTHAYVIYDDEERNFHVSHGGKQNLVRLNGKPVLNSEPLANGDNIRLGATTMRFCALCGPDFDWSDA